MNTLTRAAARQQEQEEQLGKLVSLVETHIKRLDELADEQKRQRGELMERRRCKRLLANSRPILRTRRLQRTIGCCDVKAKRDRRTCRRPTD
jgi:hypothetical protein